MEACSHFAPRDIPTWKREIADPSGIRYAGVTANA